jgi:hypothetical protein
VRNLLFSKFLGKKGKNFENSKFRTLLVSCSNSSIFCIFLLRPEFYYVRQTATTMATARRVSALQRIFAIKNLKKYGEIKTYKNINRAFYYLYCTHHFCSSNNSSNRVSTATTTGMSGLVPSASTDTPPMLSLHASSRMI